MSKLIFGLFLALVLTICTSGYASSHREAPFITEVPKCDGTDFYMFQSFDPIHLANNDTTVFIANFLPLQDPNGGPNYFFLDPEALYEIHIDNNGDAVEDITLQFRFKLEDRKATLVANNEVPVIAFALNDAPIVNRDDAQIFVRETYTITVVSGDRRKGKFFKSPNLTLGGFDFVKPIDNIGEATVNNAGAFSDVAGKGAYDGYALGANTPNPSTTADGHIFEFGLPDNGGKGKVFVGQRREGFIVELGGVFDSVRVDGQANNNNANNALRFKNITSFVVELPSDFVRGNGGNVIGAWYTSSLRQARLLNPLAKQKFGNATREGGPFSQVSRLSMPLVNELVIGLNAKDTFNSSEPKDDAQFATFVINSSLAAVLQDVTDATTIPDAQKTNRLDLVGIFLTGLKVSATDIQGKTIDINNVNGSTAEMMRLNTGDTPVAYIADGSDRLALISDVDGPRQSSFPNGRRPVDDVVDVELIAVAGFFGGLVDAAHENSAVAITIEDGAIANFTEGVYYLSEFPYLAEPLTGSGLNFPDDAFDDNNGK